MTQVHIIWPENKIVDGARILMWFHDAVENGDCADVEDVDVLTAARALDDAGLITLGRVQ